MKTNKIRVMHFTKIINRNDFIDVIVRYADKERFEVLAAAWQDESNIEYHNYPEEGIPFYNLNVQTDFIGFIKGSWKLRKLLKQQKIQVLHTHHYYETIIGYLACLFQKETKLVFGRHYHNEFYLTASGFKLKYYLWVENLINRFSSAIIVPSRVIKELLREQGISQDKIKVIHYGFDFTKPKYKVLPADIIKAKRSELGWDGKYIIGNFARHHPIKGQEYLLDAFDAFVQKVPEARLVMVGDGYLRSQLEDWVNKKGLKDKVHFLGWRKDGHMLMNLCDVIVHPTLQEAFPQTMIEVMVLKVPLLITPVSGAVDVIEDSQNGYTVPFRSDESILEKLLYLYDHMEQGKRVGEQASDFVTRELSIQKIIPQYEKVYTELMN